MLSLLATMVAALVIVGFFTIEHDGFVVIEGFIIHEVILEFFKGVVVGFWW